MLWLLLGAACCWWSLGCGCRGEQEKRSWAHVSFTVPLTAQKQDPQIALTDAKVLVRDMSATLSLDENLTWFVYDLLSAKEVLHSYT